MIEIIWGKQRILEVYLNVAEMGKGVFGSEAAARQYFKKPAKKLTQKESAMIAACLPNPKKYTIKPLSSAIKRKAPWVEQQMSNIRRDKDVKALLTIAKIKEDK
jgi:monofunctional biosynthetic peptidoglycan transglycosylase